MLLGIQIFGVFFAILMIYMVFVSQKKKEFNSTEYILWIVVWILFIVITIFPSILDFFTESLSLPRTLDLLLIMGILCILGLLFYNYIAIRKINRKVEDIVRKIAIERKKK